MATSRIKTSSVLQGFPKSRSLLAGNAAYEPGSYYSIATVTVGSGGAADVTFSSIPGTYTHLQLRYIRRTTSTSEVIFTYNSETSTGSNYHRHLLYGSGSGVTAAAGNSNTFGDYYESSTSVFGTAVVDILDYANTNKNTTTRVLWGFDANGSGYVGLNSGLWVNTAAITSIKLTASGGNNFAQYSEFALYGIKA